MQHIYIVTKKSIFPLKLRPLGPLWLPSPKSPHDYFTSIGWTKVEIECNSGHWSHKYERNKEFYGNIELKSIIDCQELNEYYPFVKRSLIDREESLIINGTVRHVVKMIDTD